jgi:hypothetical protein
MSVVTGRAESSENLLDPEKGLSVGYLGTDGETSQTRNRIPLALCSQQTAVSTPAASLSVDEPPVLISGDEEKDTRVLVPTTLSQSQSPSQQDPMMSSESTRSVPELELHSRTRAEVHPLGALGASTSSTSAPTHEGLICRHRWEETVKNTIEALLMPGANLLCRMKLMTSFLLLGRYLVPQGHRRHHVHCSRCESVHQCTPLSRHASKDSVRSIHLSESIPTTSSNALGTSMSREKDPHIRRQYSQPESTCLYCQTHRSGSGPESVASFKLHLICTVVSCKNFNFWNLSLPLQTI